MTGLSRRSLFRLASAAAVVAVAPDVVATAAGFVEDAAGAWLPCDGAMISRAAYPDLFRVIGEAYGAGDGATTFALPVLYEAGGAAEMMVKARAGADTLPVGCLIWWWRGASR